MEGRILELDLPSLIVCTDASLQGYGATWGSHQLQGTWQPDELSLHINQLELRAIYHACLHWANQWTGHHVQLLCDNKTAVAMLRHQGSNRLPHMHEETGRILKFQATYHFRLSAEHIPGSFNVQADALSRNTPIASEWSLDAPSFLRLQRRFGPFSVDMFATAQNAQTQVFVAPFPGGGEVAVNALSVDWSCWAKIYAFPPWSFLPGLLPLLKRHRHRTLLIAPLWPAQRWFSSSQENLSPSGPSSALSTPSDSARHSGILLPSVFFQASRLDLLISHLQLQMSPTVAAFIARRLAPSTIRQYQSVFKKFQSFLTKRHLTTVTESTLLDYFYEKFQEGWALRTLRTHRAGLHEILSLVCHIDTSGPLVSKLFQGFLRARPINRRPPPRWSLSTVLDTLMLADWRTPLCASPLKFLQKAFFLTALASGSRIGELTAMRRDSPFLEFAPDRSQVTITPPPSFRFKTHRFQKGHRAWSIPAFYQDDGTPHFLCPVQALFDWLQISAGWNGACHSLWLHPVSRKPLNSARIAYFFKRLIASCCPPDHSATFHDIRGLSTSLAFFKGLSLDAVCERAMWSSSHTFVRHYLQALNLSLPPCVLLGVKCD